MYKEMQWAKSLSSIPRLARFWKIGLAFDNNTENKSKTYVTIGS
jgi:hypothetical protein